MEMHCKQPYKKHTIMMTCTDGNVTSEAITTANTNSEDGNADDITW